MATEGQMVSTSFWTEKKEGHGEDAPPILMPIGKSFVVGVFDGMGGAGAAVCNSVFGDKYTQAYVASRIVRDAMKSYLTEHLPKEDISEKDMKETIMNKLRGEQEKYSPQTKSMLRSKLVREYPTTMALVVMKESEKSINVDSYWAGDSHCYLWTKDGFFQISRDDLEADNNPLENLHNDSPISNCICADRDFTINHCHIELPVAPTIILAATDGCFGYYPTPMHFEYIINDCLQKAKDEKDWGELMKEEILKVTGDDCSLSLVGVGYGSFPELKKVKKSHIVKGFPGLRETEDNIAWLKQQLSEQEAEHEELVSASWTEYKDTYMKYLNERGNGIA